MTTQYFNVINDKTFYSAVWRISIPIALQSLISSSLNLIDNLMVGSLGETALNAVGIASQIFFVYWMVLFGFISGTSTYISQFFGTSNMTKIKNVIGFAFAISISVALIFFLVAVFCPQQLMSIFTGYEEVIHEGAKYLKIGAVSFFMSGVTMCFSVALKATQQTKMPLYASVIALSTNTILNYLLIYGNLGFPAMGINGVALATVISRALEMGIILFIVFGKKNILCGKVSEFFHYERDLVIRIVKNALPTTVNELLWGVGIAMYAAAYARISITAGAAIQACNTINNIFYMVAFAIGEATLIILGPMLGRNEATKAFDVSKKLIRLAIMVSVVLGVVLIITGVPLLRLFNFSPEGINYAQEIILIYGMSLWLSVYNAVHISGTLRSGGDTRFAMIVDVGTVWLIGVPAAFLTALYLKWPVALVVLAVKSGDFVKAILCTYRYLSKKWIKNMVKGIT